MELSLRLRYLCFVDYFLLAVLGDKFQQCDILR